MISKRLETLEIIEISIIYAYDLDIMKDDFNQLQSDLKELKEIE